MSWWNSLSTYDCLIIGTLLLFIIYKALTWNHDYFAKKNIPYCKPLPIVGNNLKSILGLQTLTEAVQEMYNTFPEHKVFGIFQFSSPALMIRDPELLKQITVKDFDHFTDHKMFIPDGIEPLLASNLFALKGQKWRHVRALLSPAFTSSKMKGMFHLIADCGQQFVDYLETQLKDSDQDILELDMKSLFTKFTNDTIATTAFGITCDSLKNPTNSFYKFGREITNFGWLSSLKFAGYFICPTLMKILKIGLFSKEASQFLHKTVHETIEIREREGIVRPDMIHLLMQARKGELKDEEEVNDVDEKDTAKTKTVKYDLTDIDITSQAMIFFVAGFDTAATLMSFASLLLAIHQDIQKRLQEEIDQTLDNCKGHITYDALQKMKYLDMVILETLRLYPPQFILDRECVKPYSIRATDNTPEILIKTKEQVIVPVHAMHHDPLYYPDPEKFDPERFSDENKHNIKPFTYFPFGVGPRICIGNRFALMENKIALLFLLSHFSLHVTSRTSAPIKLSARTFLMMPEKGFWIGIKKRQKSK